MWTVLPPSATRPVVLPGVHRERMGTSIVLELRRKAMVGSHMIEFPATLEDHPVFGFTCPCCGFDQGIEHRLQIER